VLPFAGLLFMASYSEAAPVGEDTLADFINLHPDNQAMYLRGAFELAGGLGISCTQSVSSNELHKVLLAQAKLGRVRLSENFTVALYRTLKYMGCTPEASTETSSKDLS
jgi:hypothetical protein